MSTDENAISYSVKNLKNKPSQSPTELHRETPVYEGLQSPRRNQVSDNVLQKTRHCLSDERERSAFL